MSSVKSQKEFPFLYSRSRNVIIYFQCANLVVPNQRDSNNLFEAYTYLRVKKKREKKKINFNTSILHGKGKKGGFDGIVNL